MPGLTHRRKVKLNDWLRSIEFFVLLTKSTIANSMWFKVHLVDKIGFLLKSISRAAQINLTNCEFCEVMAESQSSQMTRSLLKTELMHVHDDVTSLLVFMYRVDFFYKSLLFISFWTLINQFQANPES